jgi:TonB family protein
VAASTDRPVFEPTRESEYPVPPAQIPLVYEPETVVPAVQKRNREVPKPARPVELPPPREAARTAPRMEMPAAPELTAVARLDRPPLVPERKLLAETAVEPAKPSAIRRAVGSIPGFGFLKRRKKDFIAPRAIRQVRPTVPGLVADNDPVRVKVLVDEQGKVADAELVTRKSDPKLAALAIEAAREWQFKPATVNEKPVETELILQFRFPAGAND